MGMIQGGYCAMTQTVCPMLDHAPQLIDEVYEMMHMGSCPETSEYCVLTGGCAPRDFCSPANPPNAMQMMTEAMGQCHSETEDFCLSLMGCVTKAVPCEVHAMLRTVALMISKM